ncbi:MAG: hypothetical protein IPK26_28270 [Planctomycetes bacterium]|nr:hypothetical protein [Planctomycetota bacterium]
MKTLVALFLVSAAMAQEPKPPESAANLTFRGVAIDQPVPGGPHYARGETWKMVFGDGTATFYPLLGAAMDRHWPVAFALAAATIGGRDLPIGRGEAGPTGPRQLTLQRGVLTEVWDLAGDHAKQSFVLRQLPGPGDLVLDVACVTDMNVARIDGGELTFTNPMGSGIACADAVVVDAKGRRLPLDLHFADGHLRLRVPAEFLASASWPVVVDPIVRTVGIAQTATQFRRPRAAFDPTANVWLVVCEDVVTATDTDVLAFRLTLDGTVLDNSIVELGTARSQRPDVAANVQHGKFLLAWLLPGQARVVHRHRLAAGTTYEPQADFVTGVMDQNSVLALGGARSGDHCLLTWTVDFAPSEFALARTVDAQNQSSADIALANSLVMFRLACTDRQGPGEDWGVALQDASSVRFVGVFTTAAGLAASPPLTLPGHASEPVVAGSGQFLVTSFGPGSPGNIVASRVSARLLHDFAIDFSADLTQLENPPTNVTSRTGLTLASDGCRFVYSFREDHTNTPTATVLNTIRQVRSGLSFTFAFDERRIGSGRVGPEPSLCAAAATGGPAGAYLLLEVDSGPNLAGVRYDGRIAGDMFTTVTTRCGAPFAPLIGAQGFSVVGGSYEVQLARTTGAPLLLGGFPEATPVATCGPNPACLRGVRLPAPTVMVGTSLIVNVPCDANLLGTALAFQGVDLLGVGGCPASEFGVDFRLSDTVIATVR